MKKTQSKKGKTMKKTQSKKKNYKVMYDQLLIQYKKLKQINDVDGYLAAVLLEHRSELKDIDEELAEAFIEYRNDIYER